MSMRPVDYIYRLAATSSKLEKEAILRAAAVDGVYQLFIGFRMAYDNRTVFGVKQVPKITGDFTQSDLDDPGSFTWDNFITLSNQLETRALTGNAARDALHQAAKRANISEWNDFYRPILMKDMRCGVNETTVNKVLESLGGKAREYIVPVWSVMLADDSKKHQKKLVGSKLLDHKLDGVRLTTVVDVKNKQCKCIQEMAN